MFLRMRLSWIAASSAFKEVMWKAPAGFSLPPNTFYISSRSWHLFSRPSVKLSRNILEKPLSLDVDNTVPLNPGDDERQGVLCSRVMALQITLLETSFLWLYWRQIWKQQRKNKEVKEKKKQKRKQEWKELKQWEGVRKETAWKLQLNHS